MSKDLARDLMAGQRRALAQAITLIESSRRDHRLEAEKLLSAVLPRTGGAVRLGISGVPGVGKSTFIESFGLSLIEAGKKVAVLAVDPSSRRSGGSILGDKTRMEELTRREEAFIRPSPAGESLGGVARRTREALLLCEAAGYDVVIVETVGVGQSETAVADMVDLFLLLLLPSGGDELQGIKRGIVELADLVVVNKADGALVEAARRAAAEYQSALRMLRPVTHDWQVPVLLCSALEGRGLEEVWARIEQYRALQRDNGLWEDKRENQASAWLWREVEESLLSALHHHPPVAEEIAGMESAVRDGSLTPSAAARRLLEAFGIQTQG